MKKKEQDASLEKNQSSQEIASEYNVDSLLKDLEDIAPWQTDEYTTAMMQWSDRQYFQQSEFQNRYYVVGSHVTPYRQLQQAVMEVQVRYNGMQKIAISYKRCLNDIERIKWEIENEENPFYKKDKEYELELLLCDKQLWVNKLKQSQDEISGFISIIKERTGEDPSTCMNMLEDKQLKEEEEHKYWIARMAKQASVDLLTTGRIQAGNLESMLQMSPEDQTAITDLALTYSTAVNRSVGAIKEAAEERVDKLLNGKSIQMFDTTGVLTDYASNNITDRLLQSADKPKT
jgi:hypothetical protein